MAVHQEDVEAAKKYLWEGETVQATATQRKNPAIGGTIINPTTILATDKRVIIINRETLGIRKDVETIPYNRVASVRMESGFVSSSVFLRVGGYSSSGEQGFIKKGEQEGEIPGLEKADAKDITDCVNRMISGMGFQGPAMDSNGAGQQQQAPRGGGGAPGAHIFCSKCGAENELGAKFCSACGAEIGR